jgi:hypothetical protein
MDLVHFFVGGVLGFGLGVALAYYFAGGSAPPLSRLRFSLREVEERRALCEEMRDTATSHDAGYAPGRKR